MRHRIAGNRINMPGPKRRAAFRNLLDGLFIYEAIKTTDARAKAVRGEAEHLIALAIRGHNQGWAHLKSVVDDDYLAEQVMALVRKGRFRMDETIPTNEERAAAGKYPLSEEARKLKQDRLQGFQKEALGLFKDRETAQKALDAAREAIAIELHARREVMRHLPQHPKETTVRKIFEQYVPRYSGRNGGYTRITKVGRRLGDAAEIVSLELV